jgi:hypothetical protein
MPGLGKIRAACVLLVCGVALSACGSSDDDGTIPAANADALLAQLSQVQDAVNNGDCTTATANAHEFVDAVNQLPDTTGADTKAELRSAGENLETLAKEQCNTGPTGATGAKPQSSTSSTVAPPTTTTTSSTTSTTTTTTSTQKPPPETAGGNEGPGGGSSQGGGGGADIGGGTGGTGGPGKGD